MPSAKVTPGRGRRGRALALSCLTRAARHLPPSWLRGGLGLLARGARWSRAERQTRANLELVHGAALPDSERARLAAAVRQHAAHQLSEWLQLAASDERRERLLEGVRFDASIERLEGLLAEGRGALVVTAHLGNWELLAAAVVRAGHGGAVVGRQRPNDPGSRWMVAMRQACDVRTLPQDTHPREVLRVLAAGGVVGLLCDLEVPKLAGTFVPFFGKPALTMTAPAAFARATGLPLLPARCLARGRGKERHYELSFEAPLFLDPELGHREATVELTARLNALFEGWIRADPEQWAWHQPRWRIQPGQREIVPQVAHRLRAKESA